MNTAILLVCVLIPILAASLFYVSDRRAARDSARASPVLVGHDAEGPDVDDGDEVLDDPEHR